MPSSATLPGPSNRSHRALFAAVCLPCVALAVLGARLIQNERILEERRIVEARQRTGDEMSRAIVDQLQGIVGAETAGRGSGPYVEEATEFVATLDSSGVHLAPERLDRLTPQTRAILTQLSADSITLAFLRGALGEPRIVAYDHGRLLLTLRYHDRGPAQLVAARTTPLLAAAGVALGDSLQLLGRGVDGAVQLGNGIDGLWLWWKGPVAVGGPWRDTQRYYLASLLLVGALGALGIYLLARDTRRESRVVGMRQNFIAAVSHELKTPLTSIRMFAETMRDRALAPAARAEYLDTVINETDRLSRLVDNVLEFTRVERGERTYRLAENDLLGVVRRALDALENPLTQQGFRVTLRFPDVAPVLKIDADAVEQVMLNLLTNAMKYSGGSREIEISVEPLPTEVRIVVRDRGIGIAPAEHERIFDGFYRSPRLSPEIAGTGLGLTLVQHVVAAHGGRVSVDSVEGQGSSFNVFLPAGAT